MESPKQPQPPPFLSYTPESLSAAANHLIAASSKHAGIRLSHDAIQRHSRDDVFPVVDAVSRTPEIKELPLESRVYLRKFKREFLTNSLGLRDDPESRARLKEANLRLVALLRQYTGNLSGESGGLWLASDELDGHTPAVLERFKIMGEDGKLWVTFKTPDRIAVESRVHSVSVRQKYGFAWEDRIADAHGPLLDEVLRLRRETAQILKFRNFAESRNEDRMMPTKDATDFLSSVSGPLLDVGQRDLDKLSKLKEAHLKQLSPVYKDGRSSSTQDIFRWDLRYYRSMMMDQDLKMDLEKVYEYYPFQLILPKLFDIFSLFLGIRIVILDPAAEGIVTWHEIVMVMSVGDEQPEETGRRFMGYLYIDPYPREGKYGHVGQTGLQVDFLRPDGTRHYPVSCLMLNYAPPTASRPICTHGSTSKRRDFVEVPSKMLEHLFYDCNIIRAVSCHYNTGAQIPEALIDDLIATRYDNASMNKLSDLVFADFDMAVHTSWEPNEVEQNPSLLFEKIRREKTFLHGPVDLGMGYGAVQSATRLRFVNGYAASYYSYLLADAFSTNIFQAKLQLLLTPEKCDDLSDIINERLRAEGRRYRYAILEPGSSTGHELGLIKSYLGRDPNPKSFVDVLAKKTRL
ncbi:hypothetical protein BJ170DRAFT_599240 [Xylariales sp. AK1849]|nr:hypothetical protein BJ170DRAFT_599240 [Xylariales sp. AK1849]